MDELSPSLSELTSEFFGENSPLQNAEAFGGRPYEERPQQIAMAEAIALSLEAGQHLAVEAPTGVGKSFAYLIPAIIYAKQCNKPVIISTHTIALQEQLMLKDIPMLKKILDIPFSAALAKGRSNYLCLQRLNNCKTQEDDYLPDARLMPEITRISRWAEGTEDGTLADLDFKPSNQTWQSVCSEPGVCKNEKKYPQADCYFIKARRKLFTADIIVANHAMLCSDLAMRADSENQQSMLPDYGAVILDEAQTFEEVAATHLGIRISSFAVNTLFGRLYNTRSNKGLLSRTVAADARQASIDAYDETDRFFKRIHTWLEDQAENPCVYKESDHIPNQIGDLWFEMEKEIGKYLKTLDAEDNLKGELQNALSRITGIRHDINHFLTRSIDNSVYWFERFGRQKQFLSFNVVPIEVKDILRDLFFTEEFPVIMTSATMAVNQNLDYFKSRLGCDESSELILDTPFDFERQVTLRLPASKMPDPRDSEAYLDAICTQIQFYVKETQGKAFVLFTNFKQMHIVADILHDFFKEQGYRLLVQGKDLQRTQMLDIFREDIHSVLFGTDSFWMGVDVPGESLSNVMIVRLPFPVPSHPLTAAICKRLEENGQSSFFHYSLPEAVLKFRQGAGRLIRSQNDTGIIVVFDPRIVKTGYGKSFIDSLPPCQISLE